VTGDRIQCSVSVVTEWRKINSSGQEGIVIPFNLLLWRLAGVGGKVEGGGDKCPTTSIIQEKGYTNIDQWFYAPGYMTYLP
jgi:hypothetical protein